MYLATPEQLQEFKEILEAEQSGVVLMMLQDRRKIGIVKSADLLEEVAYAADSELAMVNLSRYSDLLRRIRAALARIEDETYGVCLCCGTTIGPKRLRAVPWTPLCIRCQEAADRNDAEVREFVHEVNASAA